jgi:hypothetical protein
MYENILKADGARKLADIGSSELIVGIPTFKNGKTVARVIQAAAQGLQSMTALNPVIAVIDGGSSDNTLYVANNVIMPPGVRRVSGLYYGVVGKGSGVHALLEMGRALHARAVVVLEADLESIEPHWVERLAAPILSREYDYAAPYYARPLPGGAVTDLIAYPLTRALYNVEVRQPMGGDLALSGSLATKLATRDVWETDVAKHGVDIWLTTIAINEDVRGCQVRLGYKTDYSRETLLSLDPTFVQAVGTLFRMLEIYRKRWRETRLPRTFPLVGGSNGHSPRPPARPDPNRSQINIFETPTAETFAEAFRSGAKRHGRAWRAALAPTNLQAVRALADQAEGPFQLSADLWARIVFDFAVVYNKGEGDPDKVAAGLLPIYFARIATMLKASGGKPDNIEQMVQEQAQIFARAKDYLVQRWETYVPWMFEGVR